MSVTVLQPDPSSLVPDVAARLDVAACAEAVSGAILNTVFPERANDTVFVTTLNRCSQENVASVMAVLVGRLALSEVDARCARDFAALVARLGIPLAELERSYWVGVERLWREWFDLCRTSSTGGPARLPELLGGSTSLLFGYVDRVLEQVVHRYTAVRAEMAASCEDRRRELVLRLIEGELAQADQTVEAALGYRMRATHVGLLFPVESRRQVTRALTELRERGGAWGALLVQVDAGTWFGWLGYPDAVGADRLEALRRVADRIGIPVTIGEPGRCLSGFRRTHETARRAEELRSILHHAPSCLCARDVRLEILLLENPESARQFVLEELGQLAAGTERAQRIRDTLLTWLSVGSHTKAAAELGVHENTVRMRIRAAAEELGDALAKRRTELLVALRLCAALGPYPASACSDQ